MLQRQNPTRFRFSSRVRAAAFALLALLALAALPAPLQAQNNSYQVMTAGRGQILNDAGGVATDVKSGMTVRILPTEQNGQAYLQLAPASPAFECRAVFHWADANAARDLTKKPLPLCELFLPISGGAAPQWEGFKLETPLIVYLTTSKDGNDLIVRCTRKGNVRDTKFDSASLNEKGKGLDIRVRKEEKNLTVSVNGKPIIDHEAEEETVNFAWGTRIQYNEVAPVGLLAQLDGASVAGAEVGPGNGKKNPDANGGNSPGASRSLLDILALVVSLLTLAGVVFVSWHSRTTIRKYAETIESHIANMNPPPVNKTSWADIADLQEKFKEVKGNLAALLDTDGRLDKIDKDLQDLKQPAAENKNIGMQSTPQRERGVPIVASDPRIDTLDTELKRLRALFYNLDAHIKKLQKERDEIRRTNSTLPTGQATPSPAMQPSRNPALSVPRNQAQSPPPNRTIQPHQAKIYPASGENWQQDWEQKRRRLEKVAQGKETDSPFRVDFEMLESYYKTLVEDWKEYRNKPPHQDLEAWKNNWRLNTIDYHLYSDPLLLCYESNAASYDLEDMRGIANDIRMAQEKRKAEMKEWRLERIEVTPGDSPLRAIEMEEEEGSEREPTTDPNQDGAFCRITPGLGGYKHNQRILRPTKAIFYRYQPPGEAI